MQENGLVKLMLVGYFSNQEESNPQGVYITQVALNPGVDLNQLLLAQGINLDEVGLVTIDGRLVDGSPVLYDGSLIKVFPFVAGG
jgi:hypothetical protein